MIKSSNIVVINGVCKHAIIVRSYGQVQINAVLSNQEQGFECLELDFKVLTAHLKEREAMHIIVGERHLIMNILVWKHGEVECFTSSHYPKAMKWLLKRGYVIHSYPGALAVTTPLAT